MDNFFSSFDIGSGLDFTVLLLLVLTSLAAIHVRNLLISTILLGIFSLLMALQYLILGAVDVAITEAAVGAGISTVLFLLALFFIRDNEKKSKSVSFIPIIVVILVSIFLTYATLQMPIFGNANSPAQTHVASYYLQNAPAETGIPNVVTSILASYRGFDTFGEVLVVFTAAIAVLLILARSKNEEGKS